MKQERITVGTVVNAHGVRGELKINPSGGIEPQRLASFRLLRFGGTEVKIKSARVHKSTVLVSVPGIETMDEALSFKGKEVTVARKDAGLKQGEYFDAELLECTVRDAETGEKVGTVSDVISYPAHKVMEVQGEQTYLIPMVEQVFLAAVDVEKGEILIHMMKGLEVT